MKNLNLGKPWYLLEYQFVYASPKLLHQLPQKRHDLGGDRYHLIQCPDRRHHGAPDQPDGHQQLSRQYPDRSEHEIRDPVEPPDREESGKLEDLTEGTDEEDQVEAQDDQLHHEEERPVEYCRGVLSYG